MSITQNKKRIPLLNLLISYIFAKSACQILSIKGECTFLFPNFLIFGLCNFSANSFFGIFSFLTADLFGSVGELPEKVFFFQKIINH